MFPEGQKCPRGRTFPPTASEREDTYSIVADVLETSRTGGGPASFERIFRSKDDDE